MHPPRLINHPHPLGARAFAVAEALQFAIRHARYTALDRAHVGLGRLVFAGEPLQVLEGGLLEGFLFPSLFGGGVAGGSWEWFKTYGGCDAQDVCGDRHCFW